MRVYTVEDAMSCKSGDSVLDACSYVHPAALCNSTAHAVPGEAGA